jgi:alkaline phosphatase D
VTRLVFASCVSHEHDERQVVWKDALAQRPEWLILGGDNIYMDYWPRLEEPRRWSVGVFAERMHAQYAAQFAIPSFRALVSSIPAGQVLGVWDDHDFAWDNAYGTDADDDMPEKKRVANVLFRHYFAALNARPLPVVLPPAPPMPAPGAPLPELYRALDLGEARALLCDVRTYREDRPRDRASAQLLGTAQEAWLLSEIARLPKLTLIVSGSVLFGEDNQSWSGFGNFYARFLQTAKGLRVLFLGGDIHRNRLSQKRAADPVEAVSSAAALGFPYQGHRHFGLVELDDREVRIFLYRRGYVQYAGVVSLASGKLRKLDRGPEPVARLTAKRASAQRAAAMRSLRPRKKRA